MKRWWIAAAVLVLDLVVKAAAPGWGGGLVLIPGLLGLTCTYNTGMAFSMFSGQPWLLGLLSLIAVVVGWLILRRYRLGPWSQTGAMLVLGGAVGNGIERLLFGKVTDMFEVLAFRFAIFNVADAAVVIGCCLLALSMLIKPDEWRDRDGRD